MTYILKVRTDIEREDIKSVMEHLPALEKEKIMAGLAQEFRDEWYDKGITDEKAKSLIRLLEGRFGSISDDTKTKINGAKASTIDDWFDKAIKASSLDDIFKSKK